MNNQRQTFNTRYEVILVTPDMAASWLKSNAKQQRNLSTLRVKEYASMMRRNEWMVTHQAIGIDRQGNVIDGQHRLSAVVSAGIPVSMTVAFDVDPLTFRALDRGFSRTYEQIAKVAGVDWVNSNMVAGAHSLLWKPGQPGTVNNRWGAADLIDVLNFFKDDIQVAYPPKYSGGHCLIQAPIRGAVLRALVSGILSKERATDFIYCIATGLPTESGGVKDNAALILRDYMLKTRPSKIRTVKFTTFCVTLRVIKHFNEGTVTKYSGNLLKHTESEYYGWFPTFLDVMPSYMSFQSFVDSEESLGKGKNAA